jgi:hypothetical protein
MGPAARAQRSCNTQRLQETRSKVVHAARIHLPSVANGWRVLALAKVCQVPNTLQHSTHPP